MTTRRAPARKTPAKKKAKKKTPAKRGRKAFSTHAPEDLVNHIALVLDRSPSMSSVGVPKVLSVFNEQLKNIRDSAKRSGQTTTMSFYVFDQRVEQRYFTKPI